ncbi:MAG: hypothetical protein ACREJU_16755 [Nitrospiraceae bacterium]
MRHFDAEHLVKKQLTPQAASFRIMAVVLAAAFFHLAVVPAGWAQNAGGGSDERQQGTGAQYGLGAASVFLSIPYGIGKFVFATLGGIFGGFTYAFSGGNQKAAKSVWNTSMRGTYVITPEHLKGEKAVRFLGVPAEEEEMSEEPTPSLEPMSTPEPMK